MRSAEPGRPSLLDAGRRLLATEDIARLAVNAIVAEAARESAPPGLDRLAPGMLAYLDGCLAEPATKALLVQARTDAALGPHVAALQLATRSPGIS